MIDTSKLRSTSDGKYTIHTLSEYDDALKMASDTNNPNRYAILNAYKSALDVDSHLNNVYKLRVKRVTGLKYILRNGSKDVSELINNYWFRDIVKYTMQSVFWGNSLIQIEEGNEPKVELIDRLNVIPETQSIKYNPYTSKGDVVYASAAYSRNLIDVNYENDPFQLGELAIATRWSLIKYQAILNWAEFLETYLQPLAIATTDSKDVTQRRELIGFLETMGRKKYIVKPTATKLEFTNPSNGTNVDVYSEFLDYVDAQISESVLGASMLTTDGSSYSQAKVHLDTSLVLTKDDIEFVNRVVNSLVIPKLISLGIIPDDTYKFEVAHLELLTPEQQLAIDKFLVDTFEIDTDYFSKKYNVPITGLKNASK